MSVFDRIASGANHAVYSRTIGRLLDGSGHGGAGPDAVRRDAERFFREPELPDGLLFFDRLSPVHQRRFIVELWEALSKASIGQSKDATNALIELVEGWEFTAALDVAPEVATSMDRPDRVFR
jgi:hypothetical protein